MNSMNCIEVIHGYRFVGGSNPGWVCKIALYSLGFTALNANLNLKSACSENYRLNNEQIEILLNSIHC